MLNFRKIAAACNGEIVRKYYTQDLPDDAAPQGVDPAGRDLDPGERLTAYYTGRGERASFRPDMPRAVAQTLGIDPRQVPKDADLDLLFEAKRADTGVPWSKQARQISGFDFVFSPEKSASLAAAFATTPAEAAAIKNAILAANDAAMRYAATDLGFARKGHAGEDGADPGEVGWVTFVHDAARPTLALQDGPNGATYLIDAPIAGDPHYHPHNFLPNMVVTEDGRIGSIDARALTADRVHEYGAYFQAQLADRLRALGVRIDYDAGEQAVVLPDIPASAVDLFSKRDRQVLGDAKAFAKDRDLDWDELDIERKKRILHEASAAGKLGKTKEDERESWHAQAAEIGWVHESVLNKVAHKPLTDAERFERAYERAARHLAKEFKTAAVIDHGKLRVHAVRGLIGAGIAGGRDDVDHVVALIEERGLVVNGAYVSLVKGTLDDNLCVTHTEQIRIEQQLCHEAQRAALDRSGALSTRAIRNAMALIQKDDPTIAFTEEQEAAIYAMGQGSRLSLLSGVAGSGKTTLLKPLVTAWKAGGRALAGMSTAWRQADALKDASIEETWALQPLLRAIDAGEFQPTEKTVLIIDEISQIAPRPMLKLLELQAKTGMTIKMLGDREQCQSIEAGDTIELLRRVLPKFALPELLTAMRQKDPGDRKIASLFREGKAAEALQMKREDGTATLLEGDYDQVVGQIADFYIERNDLLRAVDDKFSMTVTTLTNAEAADISQAIRRRLKERGKIGQDETIHKAVYYKGDKPEFFDLPIASGDKLRLYRRTWAKIDGKGGSIGNNGDIVDVVGKTAGGLLLRDARGRVGEVEWRRLSDQDTGRLLLGFGRAFTVDAAQGMSTRGEHANALAHGSAGSTAFKTYTGESRATGKTHTLISKAAVLSDVRRSRALGDTTPITEDDLWKRIGEDTSAKPYKALAIDLLAAARRHRDQAVDVSLRAHQRIETAASAKTNVGRAVRATVEGAAAREALARQRISIEETLQRCATMLKDAAEMIMDHLQGRRPAAQAIDVLVPVPAAIPAPEAPSPPSANSSALAREAEHPSPPCPPPSPGM